MDTLTQQQQNKLNELFKELEILMRNAKNTGKTLEKYLIDLKLEPEIAAQLSDKAKQIEDNRKAQLKTIEKVVRNHKAIPAPQSEANGENHLTSKPQEKMNATIKKTVLDIIKWGIIIFFISIAFEMLYPKFHFIVSERRGDLYRCNSITGQVEVWDGRSSDWIILE